MVDVVHAGDVHSDETHGYVGHDASSGITNGRTFRQANGWMRYALSTFDDTEVTLECTFGVERSANHNARRRYDVLVEDSLIATRTFTAYAQPTDSGALQVLEIRVPFSVTKGRTSIAVTIRGHDGPTPKLYLLRVLQDHNEVDQHTSFPIVR